MTHPVGLKMGKQYQHHMIQHPHHLPRGKGTSFFMSMLQGKGGGMLGAGAGGAVGSYGTYFVCKKFKKCKNKCLSAPPTCTGCLDSCAQAAAVGAGALGAAGSGIGQGIQNRDQFKS